MNNLLPRLIGFTVIISLLTAITWAGYSLYQLTYQGERQYVVMPEGTSGVVPGSSVNYEGVEVGEVTDTTPLAHASPDLREKAFRTYQKKRNLIGETSETYRDFDAPARMALISILIQDPSIPLNSSTYATGSAYYVTGQGYITLKNRPSNGQNNHRPTFIPSSIRQFWIERLVNMTISLAPYIENAAEFHKQFQKLYHASDYSETSDMSSNRNMFGSVSESIDSWLNTAESLDRQAQEAEPVLNGLHTTLDSAIEHMPQSRMDASLKRKVSDVESSFTQSVSSFNRSFRNQYLELQYAIQSMDVQMENADSQTLKEGLID